MKLTNKIGLSNIAIFILFRTLTYAQQIHYSVSSPNKFINVSLNAYSKNKPLKYDDIKFTILYRYKGNYEEILPPSTLGINTKDQDFNSNLVLAKAAKPIAVHDRYQMLTGKRKNCDNLGNERIFQFVNKNGKRLDIVFRVYNDGVAFRYVIPGIKGKEINIINENTCFNIADSTERWTQVYTDSYEDFYRNSKDGKGEKTQQWVSRHCLK